MGVVAMVCSSHQSHKKVIVEVCTGVQESFFHRKIFNKLECPPDGHLLMGKYV